MTEIVLYEAQKHEHLIPSFVEVHIACTLENGQTLAYFRPPFTPARRDMMHKFWEERLALTKPGGSDEVVIAFNEDPQGEKKLSGFVQLHMPWSESGPFRGYVQTLCVSPDFRRLGIATKMMKKVDEVAKDKGRWNLTLATAKPSPARSMYPKLGYIEYGTIPNFIMHADTGELMDQMCFYKDLRQLQ